MSLLAQRLLMASGGKKDPTYLDDVFSTYLYEGRGTTQEIGNEIKLSNNNAGFGVEFNSSQTDGIYTAGSDGFKFETGDFTVEHWMYTDFSGTGQVIDGRDWGASGDSNWSTSITSSNEYRLFAVEPGTSAEIRITNNTTLNTNTWYHIAIVRSSGTTKMYIDGVQQSQTWADANNYTNTTLTFGVHGPNHSSFPFNGKLSNVRVVKGTAVYTSNFTPPTKALTNISGTELLCCQSSASPSLATVDTSTLLTLVNTPVVSSGPFTGSDAKGGMVWIKPRGSGYHYIVDSERNNGAGILNPNTNDANANNGNLVSSLNNGGFTLGTLANANTDGDNYASWTFAKQEGFFDIVTYTGNGTSGTPVNHSLGCVPGCIIIKRTSGTAHWVVFHRDIDEDNFAHYSLSLNETNARWASSTIFNDTKPTSTQFTLGDNERVNTNGSEYVAYLFAGGASDEPGSARSVEFDGNDSLSISDSSDFDLGSGNWTIEGWIKFDGLNADGAGWLTQWVSGQYSWYFGTANTNSFVFGYSTTGSNIVTINSGYTVKDDGQYHHYAVTRSGNTTYLFVDGVLVKTDNTSYTINNSTNDVVIGNNPDVGSGWYLEGKISNLRLVKGTALYTSSFRPPTAGLTDITNTKLLCCNKNTVTGSTITPSTITSNGDPQSSTSTPFDDPAGFKFGEEGDQNLIKTGSYRGTGSSGLEVNLGFEPQYLLIKNTSRSSTDWQIFDSMRGIVTGYDDAVLSANSSNAEGTSHDYLDLTSTGFKLITTSDVVNYDGDTYVYMVIRRPDAFVGKPPAVGTDAFAMETGNSSSAGPSFDANFDVDFSLLQQPWSAGTDWRAFSRSTSLRSLATNTPNAEVSETNNTSDYNNGIGHSYTAVWQSWMWKRHAGFDVLTYVGDGVAGRQLPHSMNNAPEMVWIKLRDRNNHNWCVGHKGLDGGTNPWQKFMYLNTADGEADQTWPWNDTAPTANHLVLGNGGIVNGDADPFIAYLFASVEGISKVDFWIGDGTNNRQITLGFQPRFLLVTLANQGGGYGWQMMDSWRGFISPNNNILRLNNNNANSNQDTYFTPTATGMTITESAFNGSNQNWIYYAHA